MSPEVQRAGAPDPPLQGPCRQVPRELPRASERGPRLPQSWGSLPPDLELRRPRWAPPAQVQLRFLPTWTPARRSALEACWLHAGRGEAECISVWALCTRDADGHRPLAAPPGPGPGGSLILSSSRPVAPNPAARGLPCAGGPVPRNPSVSFVTCPGRWPGASEAQTRGETWTAGGSRGQESPLGEQRCRGDGHPPRAVPSGVPRGRGWTGTFPILFSGSSVPTTAQGSLMGTHTINGCTPSCKARAGGGGGGVGGRAEAPLRDEPLGTTGVAESTSGLLPMGLGQEAGVARLGGKRGYLVAVAGGCRGGHVTVTRRRPVTLGCRHSLKPRCEGGGQPGTPGGGEAREQERRGPRGQRQWLGAQGACEPCERTVGPCPARPCPAHPVLCARRHGSPHGARTSGMRCPLWRESLPERRVMERSPSSLA